MTNADLEKLALSNALKVKECINKLKSYDSPALWHLEKLMDEFISSKKKHKEGKDHP